MKTKRIDLLAQQLALLSVLVISWGNIWAASGICMYPESSSGIGGTGISGSGIGGTGGIAKGSGIGGTGVRQQTDKQIRLLAGNVILSEGVTEAQSIGRSRILAKGDPVCVGETIVTSKSGMLEVRMTDGGLITVRPQTHLEIEKYAYYGTKNDNSLLSLLKGTCRIITGKIGKQYPQNDLIKTPNVLIGIRGTDHEATVILPGDDEKYPPGTYDKVNQGITFIRTEKGEIDIHPNQVGFAASARDLPTLLREMPAFYSINPSIKHDGSMTKDVSKERSETPDRHEQSKSPEKHELPGSPEIHERSESPETLELPELSEAPELPELPEAPELPELPEAPEPPELPETPGQ